MRLDCSNLMSAGQSDACSQGCGKPPKYRVQWVNGCSGGNAQVPPLERVDLTLSVERPQELVWRHFGGL